MAAKKKHLLKCNGLLSCGISCDYNNSDKFDSSDKCDKSVNTLIHDHSFFLVSLIVLFVLFGVTSHLSGIESINNFDRYVLKCVDVLFLS